MDYWTEAHQSENKLFEAMLILISKSPHLRKFLFNESSQRLNSNPDQLLRCSRGFASGEYILIKICLDLWCENGKISVHELFHLDLDLFNLTLKALRHSRSS